MLENNAPEMYGCMPLRIFHFVTCCFKVSNRNLSVKFFLFVTCMGFIIYVIWINLLEGQELNSVNENLIQEVLKNASRNPRYVEVYRKKDRLPKDFKYILLWTQSDFSPFYYLGKGQRAFINNNCSVINCYVTTNRKFFGNDITRFDAVAFNGRNLMSMALSQLPKHRSPHQKYIYFNMESADYFPICSPLFDGFFNWTSTYRLDSDIPYPYIQIKNNDGEIVGPKQDMEWIDDMLEIDEDIANRLQNKSKAIAWFISNCSTRSNREKFVSNLQKALMPYGLSVDVYGKCGPLDCPRNRKSYCDAILERDYFFYLSLENSFAKDYVTEKVLTALLHDTVPIVYGGANYSRFLPPGSYIDGRKYSPDKLASIIDHLISSPKEYREFFKWRYHYAYHNPEGSENVCAVCAMLNNETMVEKRSTYSFFRYWWYSDYKKECVLIEKEEKRKKREF